VVGADGGEGRVQLLDGTVVEGVQLVRAVDGDDGDPSRVSTVRF